MPAWIPAAIAAAASVGSTLFRSRTQRRNVDKQNLARRELAEYAYSKDLEMWRRQNEYNLPSAQMQRFKEAGLNPHLIYGQGTPGNARQMPQYNAPQMEYNYVPDVDPFSAVQGYLNMAQKSTQINYEKQKTETEFFNTWLIQTRQSNLLKEGQILALEQKYLVDTLSDRTDYQRVNTIYRAAESVVSRKRAEWARQGINPSDATWIRITLEMLKAFGVDEDRIDSLTRGLKVER